MASRVFNGCRVMFAAAKTGSTKSASKVATIPAAAVKVVKSPSKPVTEKKAAGGGALTKPVPISPALHRFVGAPEISRTQAMKKVWDYIKLHNLQNPTNKREIFPDAKLKTIFDGKDKIGMMEIAKLLSPHFIKT